MSFYETVMIADIPECAELLHVVNLAAEIEATRLILETDITGVAAKLVSDFLHGFQEIIVKSVRRLANELAHKLAKFGCMNNRCSARTVFEGVLIKMQHALYIYIYKVQSI